MANNVGFLIAICVDSGRVAKWETFQFGNKIEYDLRASDGWGKSHAIEM